MSKSKDIPMLGLSLPRWVGVEKVSAIHWMLNVEIRGIPGGQKRAIVNLDAGFILDLAMDLHKEIIKSDQCKQDIKYKYYEQMCREMP